MKFIDHKFKKYITVKQLKNVLILLNENNILRINLLLLNKFKHLMKYSL